MSIKCVNTIFLSLIELPNKLNYDNLFRNFSHWEMINNFMKMKEKKQTLSQMCCFFSILYIRIYTAQPTGIGWGDFKICWLHLFRGVRLLLSNKCLGYDIKVSGGEAPVMLELWEMQSTPSLPLLPGLLWLVRIPSMDQIEIFNHFIDLKWFNVCKQMIDGKLHY